MANSSEKTTFELGDNEYAFIVKRGATPTGVAFDFKTGPGAAVMTSSLCAALAIRSFIASGLCEELTQANYMKMHQMPDDDDEEFTERGLGALDPNNLDPNKEKQHDEG